MLSLGVSERAENLPTSYTVTQVQKFMTKNKLHSKMFTQVEVFGVLIVAVLQILINLDGSLGCLPYMPRETWDAKPPKSVEKFSGLIPFVIIHHSYEPGACLTGADCRNAMLSMQKFHQQDRGWNDIGYTFAIGGDGRIYEGRGFNVIGAHAPRYNDKSVGICMIGDWRYELPSDDMITAAQTLIEYGVRNNIIASNYTLIGHRQVRPTECPGDRLFQEIQSWPHYSPMLDVVDPNSIKTSD